MTTHTQLNVETGFDRDSWMVAAAAALYLGATLILMLIGFRFPADGWQYDDFDVNSGPLALHNISGDASSVQPGDVVTIVDGQDMASLNTSLHPIPVSEVWRTGGTTRYTVIRQDQTLELDVPLKPQPLTYWWRFVTTGETWINLIASFARLAVILFIFVRRPRSLGARALLLAFAMWSGTDIFLSTYNTVAIHFSPPTYFYVSEFFSLG